MFACVNVLGLKCNEQLYYAHVLMLVLKRNKQQYFTHCVNVIGQKSMLFSARSVFTTIFENILALILPDCLNLKTNTLSDCLANHTLCYFQINKKKKEKNLNNNHNNVLKNGC